MHHAYARAERDIAKGDLGTARNRLASLLTSNGYDAGLLTVLGELSLRMGDPVSAAKYWLLSDREGADAEAKIEAFVEAQQRDPLRIRSQLPGRIRAGVALHELADPARARVARYGLEGVLKERSGLRKRSTAHPTATEGEAKVVAAGCLAVVIAVSVLFLIGVVYGGWVLVQRLGAS